jgi:hypothetical protein
MEDFLTQNNTLGASILTVYGVLLFLLNVIIYRLIAL